MDIYEQFQIKVLKSKRARGGFLLDTDKGIKLLYETDCEEKKYAKEDVITSSLYKNGLCRIDSFVKTIDGNIVAEDEDKKRYILKNWFDCRECDTSNYSEVIEGCRVIANLHNKMEKTTFDFGEGENRINVPASLRLDEKYAKKINELIYLKNYLKKKKEKTVFEQTAYKNIEPFIDECRCAKSYLDEAGYEMYYKEHINKGHMCHSEANHHNILTNGNNMVIVSFGKCKYSTPIADLYDYMRKILEKYDWNMKLAYKMLDEYNKIRTITDRDVELITIMFGFPEKFCKIMNHYSCSKKSLVPKKDTDKLWVILEQNNARREFVESLK